MNFDDIKQILDLVREHDLAELEIERDGLKVRVRKAGAPAQGTHVVMVPPSVPAPPAMTLAASTPPAPLPEPPSVEGVELAVIKSPIVGTLYRAPEPGAASFVEVGSMVK